MSYKKECFTNDRFLIASWLVQKTVLAFLKRVLTQCVQEVSVQNYDLELKVNCNNVYPILCFLRKHTVCQFNYLTDIVCYDTLGKKLRFGIIYTLLSTRFNNRLRLVSKFSNLTGLLSVSSIFTGACWMEREVFDLFGVYFFLNTDLRRILTDYGFVGNPLRKDFPLSGYFESFYDDNQKRVSYKLVELAQEYRNFNFKHV